MKGEKQLVEKLLQTEINLLRSIRDGSALMQHMEDFYYVTLLEVSSQLFLLFSDQIMSKAPQGKQLNDHLILQNVRSRYQVVDGANDEYRQLTA